MFWPSEAEPSKFDSAQYFPAGNSVTMQNKPINISEIVGHI